MRTLFRFFAISFLYVAMFYGSFNVALANHGCWPLPPGVTTYEWCEDGSGTVVIRCECGSGSCNPSSQEFCDEPPQP